MENKELLKSGEFLVRDISPEDIFIPEEFDEEQLMIAKISLRPRFTRTWNSLKRVTVNL